MIGRILIYLEDNTEWEIMDKFIGKNTTNPGDFSDFYLLSDSEGNCKNVKCQNLYQFYKIKV